MLLQLWVYTVSCNSDLKTNEFWCINWQKKRTEETQNCKKCANSERKWELQTVDINSEFSLFCNYNFFKIATLFLAIERNMIYYNSEFKIRESDFYLWILI